MASVYGVQVEPRLLLLGGLVVASALAYFFNTWKRLKHIPGPFPAILTDFQRMFWVQTTRAHLIHQEVHEKYGEIARVGPNMVLVSNPEAIPTIYPMRPGFPKSNFYAALRPYTRKSGAVQAVFNTTDEDVHKLIKNPIAPIFSMSSAMTFEPLVDNVLELLHQKVDERFVSKGENIDLGDYVQYFAFDVMGTMTMSKRYGFLDQGKDVDGMLGSVFNFMAGKAAFTQIPWLGNVLENNAIAAAVRQPPSMSILKFVNDAIDGRKEKLDEGKEFVNESGKEDFLSRYIKIQESNPNLPPWATRGWVFSNVIAGSDSVGTVMRTTLYYLLAHPETLDKLYDELREADLSMPYPQFAEIKELPYLEACVQEGVRMHPPFALPFERVVPEGGVTILGTYLPGGTVVGGSPYVVNRHKPTFGEDAEQWNPERWLEGGPEHKRKLENSMLTFGAGRRVCLGKHVGILEIKKLITFLVLNYDIKIIDPAAFQVQNSWFFKQWGLTTTIKAREKVDAEKVAANGDKIAS